MIDTLANAIRVFEDEDHTRWSEAIAYLRTLASDTAPPTDDGGTAAMDAAADAAHRRHLDALDADAMVSAPPTRPEPSGRPAQYHGPLCFEWVDGRVGDHCTLQRHHGGRHGHAAAPTTAQAASPEPDIDDLIEASSLGSPVAKALRGSAPVEAVDAVMARVTPAAPVQRAPEPASVLAIIQRMHEECLVLGPCVAYEEPCHACTQLARLAGEILGRCGAAAPEPAQYTCTSCGASGVRLWRRYQGCADAAELKCRACSIAGSGSEPDPASDQIGWRVPAVPDGEGSFWGYTSVPQDLVDWWNALPSVLDAAK